MFKLKSFNKQFCLLARSYGLKGELCDQIMEIPKRDDSYFFTLRTMLIGLCIYGVVDTLFFTVRSYSKRSFMPLTLWQNDDYPLISPKYSRFVRTINRLVQLHFWVFLSYAAINVSPKFMWPWLTYQCLLMAVYIAKFIIDLVKGCLDWKHFLINELFMHSLIAKFVYYCKLNYEKQLSPSLDAIEIPSELK
ncbi:uncharacterized protein LOC117570121 [Drosophila albomicans]|uniref:Uncharacterized protein LOC117570121 n=1 Tax=Drosophila albomicans TaxID=7291 RepID=A0A6P8YLN4_DROAB|nr:uncharacterized protein LOC117570121 [Drosophila albomicans]